MAARSTRSSLVLFIQALYWLSLIALLLFSWIRSRGVLHPHILFCGMLFVLASDFMIRGNDDANLQGIAANNLATYQIRTLVTLILIGVSTMFVRRPYELDRSMLQPEMRVSKGFGYGMLGAGAAIIIVQQVFRLLSVDWSIDELVQQMLGPRDYRLWDLPDSSGNRSAVLQLVSGLLPTGAGVANRGGAAACAEPGGARDGWFAHDGDDPVHRFRGVRPDPASLHGRARGVRCVACRGDGPAHLGHDPVQIHGHSE
jgi:hypothetical protein